MGTVRCFADDGQEVFDVTANICVPVAFSGQARAAASDYMRTQEKVVDWQVGRMLPTALSLTGTNPPTHFLCTREVKTHQIKAMVDWIAALNQPWAAAKEKTRGDVLIDSFCVFVGTQDEFLQESGLKVIS